MSEKYLTRRQFSQAMGALGALSVAGVGLGSKASAGLADEAEFPAPTTGKPIEAKVDPTTGDVTVNPDVLVRYSSCVGCYSACGNRVHIDRATGKAFSVGGNPYNPNCAYPYLNFDEPLEKAYQSMSCAPGGQNIRGTVCGRGNGTFDAYSQPDRITMPLKRAGKRGEGKWTPISWEQLITEVTEGGKLFADLGEDREIEGFKALHDLETPISADDPEFGPIANQVVFFGSRGDGRASIRSRFTGAYGTVNAIGHGAT